MEGGRKTKGTAGSQQKMPHVIKLRNSKKSILLGKMELTSKQTCKSFCLWVGKAKVEKGGWGFTAFHYMSFCTG